jgi:hypothetical protein
VTSKQDRIRLIVTTLRPTKRPHVSSSQLLDTLAQFSINGTARLAGPQAVVGKPSEPLRHPALAPLARNSQTDTGRLGCRCQSNCSDRIKRQFQSLQLRSGILLAVHPVTLLGVLKRQELQFSRTFRVNNLLKLNAYP